MNKFFLLAFFLLPFLIDAQCLQQQMDLPQVDGRVRVITPSQSGDTLYVGGDFTAISPKITGSLAMLNRSDLGLDDRAPIVGSDVNAIVSDGNGGWYIAGNFTKIYPSSNRYFVARIRADGSLHPFNLNLDAAVKTLQFTGDRLFLGGEFSIINNNQRNFIAAVDTNGNLLNWAPNLNGTVYKMVWYNGKLYVGGGFTTAGGLPRQRLASFDTTNSVPSALSLTINQDIYDVEVDDSLLYFAGSFTSVNSTARNYVAAVRLFNNTLHSFNANVVGNWVNDLLLYNNKLLLAGNFTSAGAQLRSGFAVVNRLSGAIIASSVSISKNGSSPYVNVLYKSGSMLFAGGDFTTVNGLQRKNFAALDTGTFGLLSYKPSFNLSPLAFGVNNSNVLVGGSFTAVNTINKNGFFAYKVSTHQVLSDSIRLSDNAVVNDIAFYENKLVLGGIFDSINGQYRKNLGMITLNGTLASWNLPADNQVLKIAVAGQVIFISGTFANVGGLSRLRLAALDAQSSSVLSFAPNPNGVVNDILLSGNRLFVAGGFSQINATAKNRFASFAVDAGSISLQPWSLTVSNSYTIKQLGLYNSRLYALADSSYGDTYGTVLFTDTINSIARPYKTLRFFNDKLRQLISMTYYDSLVMYTFVYNNGLFNTYVEAIEPDGNVIGALLIGGYSTISVKRIQERIYLYGNFEHLMNIKGNYITYLDINNRPQVAVNKSAFCTSDTLTVSSSSPAGNRWQNNDTSATLTYIVPTQQLLRFYTMAPMPGCSLALSRPLYYQPLQQPGINSINVSKNPFCAEDTVTLSLNNTPLPDNRFLWSTGDTTSSIRVRQAGNYQLLISNASCQRSITPVSISTFTVPVAPTLSVSDSILHICTDSFVTIAASGGTGTYYWSDNSTFTSITTNLPGNYSVYYKGANGCNSQPSKIIALHVDTMPDYAWLGFGSKSALCGIGDSLQITTLVNNPDSVRWSTGAVGIGSIYAHLSDQHVFAINRNGMCRRISNTIDIVNDQPDTPRILVTGPSSFCQGSSVKLTSDYNGNNVWSNGATSRIVTITTSGKYTVQAVNNGCASAASDTTVVTVFAKPATPAITIKHDTLFSTVNETTEWYRDGVLVATLNTKIYKITVPGTYKARTKNTSGCFSDYSNEIYYDPTGFAEIGSAHISYYPNPVQEIFHIRSQDPVNSIRIYGMNGSLVKEWCSTHLYELDLNLSDLAAGIYSLMIVSGQQCQVIRLVKE